MYLWKLTGISLAIDLGIPIAEELENQEEPKN